MTTRPEGLILVLEDSDEDFDTVLEALKRAGRSHEVRRATTGDGCLKLLRGQGGEPLWPGVVLLDLNTPGLDGRDALREIKSDPRLKALPVVVLTTSSSPRDLQLCYESGANAYHVKPVRYVEHLSTLEHLFAYWLGRVALPEAARPSL